MKNIFQDLRRKDHKRYLGGLDVFKYIGPGLLVTVGFIDPGNWASNFAAQVVQEESFFVEPKKESDAVAQ